MTKVTEKAVWLDSIERAHNVLTVLDQLYSREVWLGGILFRDLHGGFLLVVTFNPDTYKDLGTSWEALFPSAHLRSLSFEDAWADWRRYRPWLAGETLQTIRTMRLLPVPQTAASESHPSLAQIRAERDPPLETAKRPYH